MAISISSQNSSQQALTASATYTGNGEPASAYSSVLISLKGSAVVAGTLYVGFSSNNTSWTETAFTVSDPTAFAPMAVKVASSYYRVRYVNGVTNLASFRIQSVFVINPTAGSQGPPGADGLPGPTGATGPAGPATINEVRQIISLSAGNITSKSFTIPSAPLVPANLRLFPPGGPKQKFGVDFTVSGTTVSWNGLGLDGFLSAGESVEVYYLA